MESVAAVWFIALIPWLGAMFVLGEAHTARQRSPGRDIPLSEWIAVAVGFACTVVFFVTAASAFGPIVWFIVLIFTALFGGWMMYAEGARRSS